MQSQLAAGLIPQLLAIGGHPRCLHAVHHDDATWSKTLFHPRHHLFEFTAMTANEDGIGPLV